MHRCLTLAQSRNSWMLWVICLLWAVLYLLWVILSGAGCWVLCAQVLCAWLSTQHPEETDDNRNMVVLGSNKSELTCKHATHTHRNQGARGFEWGLRRPLRAEGPYRIPAGNLPVLYSRNSIFNAMQVPCDLHIFTLWSQVARGNIPLAPPGHS